MASDPLKSWIGVMTEWKGEEKKEQFTGFGRSGQFER
jgi:hypothetical protein